MLLAHGYFVNNTEPESENFNENYLTSFIEKNVTKILTMFEQKNKNTLEMNSHLPIVFNARVRLIIFDYFSYRIIISVTMYKIIFL